MSDEAAAPKKKRKQKPTVMVSQEENGTLVGKDRDGNVLWREELTKPQRKKLEKGIAVRKYTKRAVKYTYVRSQTGEPVLVPIGFNLEKLPVPKGLKNKVIEYSRVLADQILLLVSEGFSIDEIGRMDGFPTRYLIAFWIKDHPEFAEKMIAAKKAQAAAYADKVHEIAHTVDEGNSKSAKVSMDGFKWLASVGDPDAFGNRTKITGDPNAPLGIIVETGIRKNIEAPKNDTAIDAEGGTVEVDGSEELDEPIGG